MCCRQLQQILYVFSINTTCFGHTEYPQIFKQACKVQNKMQIHFILHFKIMYLNLFKFVVVKDSTCVSLKLKTEIQMMFDDWLFMLFRWEDCIMMSYVYINEVDKDSLSSKQYINNSLPAKANKLNYSQTKPQSKVHSGVLISRNCSHVMLLCIWV
jgi:hypothetical protein